MTRRIPTVTFYWATCKQCGESFWFPNGAALACYECEPENQTIQLLRQIVKYRH